jgi:hypothetical protein
MTRFRAFDIVKPERWYFRQYNEVNKALSYENKQNSEEYVRQWVLDQLITVYGYPKEWLDTRIYVEEYIMLGSQGIRTDISIKRQDRKTIMIIEVKHRGVSDLEFSKAIKQLESYLAVTYTAIYGVVTDGERIVCLKKIREPRNFQIIDDIPSWEEATELLNPSTEFKHLLTTQIVNNKDQDHTASFTIGQYYTRKQIQHTLGGGIQSYLPHVNGRVVCGCFTSKLNPSAPYEVLVGAAPDVVKYAKVLANQAEAIPVFMKQSSNHWEYIGLYRAIGYTEDKAEVDLRAVEAKRDWVAGVLFMEKI